MFILLNWVLDIDAHTCLSGVGGSEFFLNLATSQLAMTDFFNYVEPPEYETHLVLQPQEKQ
jgi:hypothetical protein